MVWTHFWDMNSGGGTKEKYSEIFIEAPEEEAKIIFYNRFGHNPERISCTCCGEDYAIHEYETLEEATSFMTVVETYVNRNDVLVIRSGEIQDNEREGILPEEGWVWVG